MIKLLPDVSHLDECLVYNSSTGELRWKSRPPRHFKNEREHKRWNNRFAGEIAFVTPTALGHLCGKLDGVTYLAHRIIWKLIKREEPPPIIDHEDRAHRNNRCGNLRRANNGQNRANSKVTAGVHRLKNSGKWQAYTGADGRLVHLGTFASEQEAKEARRIGHRVAHGEFAPCE